jgi:hypothetical protein
MIVIGQEDRAIYEEFCLIVLRTASLKNFQIGEEAVSSSPVDAATLCVQTYLLPGKLLAKEAHVKSVLTSAPVVHLLVTMCRMLTTVCVNVFASQIMGRSQIGNASIRSFCLKTSHHSKKQHLNLFSNTWLTNSFEKLSLGVLTVA